MLKHFNSPNTHKDTKLRGISLYLLPCVYSSVELGEQMITESFRIIFVFQIHC